MTLYLLFHLVYREVAGLDIQTSTTTEAQHVLHTYTHTYAYIHTHIHTHHFLMILKVKILEIECSHLHMAMIIAISCNKVLRVAHNGHAENITITTAYNQINTNQPIHSVTHTPRLIMQLVLT